VLTPFELWEESGRDYIQEIFRLEDRKGAQYVLPMTHEETAAFHARELRSYRQLPQILYHFSVKERDEPRPRSGLIRVREFIMKDSYTFDRDQAGLDVAFEKHRRAYERIFERCGVVCHGVQAESGMMGGNESVDFLAPAEAGENTLVTCEKGDFAADLEVAQTIPRPPVFPERLEKPEEIETPGIGTIEELADFLSVDPAATAKAMPVVTQDGRVVLCLVRGDDRLEEGKVAAALETSIRLATEEEIQEAFGASGGSLGPVGFEGEIVADEALREGQFVAGANRDGWHLRGVEAGRDFQPRFADLRQSNESDSCPLCGSHLLFQTAIEVGHIFKLGTKYSEPLHVYYLDEKGKEQPIVMGSYGIGPGRVMATVIEQNRDGNRIVWPRSIAPYEVEVVALQAGERSLLETAEQIAGALSEAGYDVLLDDRDARPGEKFADADLIGAPLRATVGKKTLEDGAVDLRSLASGEERRVSAQDVPAQVEELLR
jgi:prolyl-tRNA synthetase